MNNPFIIADIAIVLILAFFAWRGAKKGLILTLFGLLGLVVAIFGARFVSQTFYEPVANIVRPGIYQSIKEAGTADSSAEGNLDEESNVVLDLPVDGLVEFLREHELFPGLVDKLEDISDSGIISQDSALDSLSSVLSNMVAKAILFAAAFVIILLLWFLISRAIDLVFKLPILSAVNWIGGLVFGLVKAVAIVVVLIWVCQIFNLLPDPPTTPIVSLFSWERIAALLGKLLA